ncbi:46205_t:CDS:1, partial [Gigaspora margarita]
PNKIKKKVINSKKITKKDQATHQEAIQAALQALEKSENSN